MSTTPDAPAKKAETYQVFARKYRPLTFDQVLGQDHVVQTLRNAIEKERIAQAYLFVGPRGTGKTTTARILAKALNCEDGPKIDFDPESEVCREIGEGRSLDVLEIDGASNNGVNEVRDLRETVQYAPASGKFRIYYIDEVHMLTNAAFNALLKTLEEPPPHVKFIFATTEPQKILPTILSRCQRFDLRRIPAPIIAEHLLYIAKNEGITLTDSAAHAVAKGADGGMRDAQSMLDQLVAFCGDTIEQKDVLDIFGLNSAETVGNLAGHLLSRDNGAALSAVHEQDEAGKDLTKLLGDLITHYRHLLVAQVDPGAENEEVGPDLKAILDAQKSQLRTSRLLALIDLLAETDARMKWAPNKRLHLEIGVIKAIQMLGESDLDDVISLIGQAAGSPAAAAVTAQPATPAPAPAATPQPAPRAMTPTPSPATTPVAEPEPAPAPAPTPEPPFTPDPPTAAPEAEDGEFVHDPVDMPMMSMQDAIEAELKAKKAAPAPAETGGGDRRSQPENQAAVTAAADSKIAENAPETPPTPTPSGLTGEPLWNAVVDTIGTERPLMTNFILAAYFLGEDPSGQKLTVGFPKQQALFWEQLGKQKDFIEAQLTALAGHPMTVEMTIDDSLQPKPLPEAEPEEPEVPEPEPVAAAPEAAPEPEEIGDPTQDPQAKDPLMVMALEKFKARQIKE